MRASTNTCDGNEHIISVEQKPRNCPTLQHEQCSGNSRIVLCTEFSVGYESVEVCLVDGHTPASLLAQDRIVTNTEANRVACRLFHPESSSGDVLSFRARFRGSGGQVSKRYLLEFVFVPCSGFGQFFCKNKIVKIVRICVNAVVRRFLSEHSDVCYKPTGFIKIIAC